MSPEVCTVQVPGVPRPLRDRFKELAKKDERTMTAEIRLFMAQRVAEAEAEATRDT